MPTSRCERDVASSHAFECTRPEAVDVGSVVGVSVADGTSVEVEEGWLIAVGDRVGNAVAEKLGTTVSLPWDGVIAVASVDVDKAVLGGTGGVDVGD